MSIKKIHLSVRDIVEFVLRGGNIDARFFGMKRALEGIKVHNKVQKKRAAHAKKNKYLYESEVPLKFEFEHEGTLFEVEGRCDGLLIQDGSITIEELKSTAFDVSQMQPNLDHWHFAQCKFYGFIYCTLYEVSDVTIMVTYCELETLTERSFAQTFTHEELRAYFFSVFDAYYEWLALHLARLRVRDDSIDAMTFPHEVYRKGQREFAVAVYKTLVSEKKLFAQAPTGTGKTISTLFPAIKYIKDTDKKIFYLTAKTITKQVASDACHALMKKGLRCIALTLTAKEKICLGQNICTPDQCPYAKGHFDRINAALKDIVLHETLLDRQTIENYAKTHQVCPSEFALELTDWVDLILCDYNYVFDPKVSLKRFFSDNAPPVKHVVLVDEAHNLVDRSREMYSAALSKSDFAAVKRKVKALPLAKITKKLNEYRESMEEETATLPEEFVLLLMGFVPKADAWLAQNEGHDMHDQVLTLYFAVMDFIKIAEFFGDGYVVLFERAGKDITIRLCCLDPSELLKQCFRKVHSTIVFSATLTPLDYFSAILGGEDTDNFLRIASPFDPNNLCILLNDTISTKFRNRNQSYAAIADNIYSMVVAKKGNYLVFFSSYQYLNSVRAIFSDKHPAIRTIVQEQQMTEAEREDYIDGFGAGSDETLVGFAVLGGLFSEGIDLTGDKLIGVCIVGVGLPFVTPVRNLMCDYFNRKEAFTGFSYAYVNPGMNKVLQASGRVIRTETDRGVLLLLDERYKTAEYQRLFPKEWAHVQTVKDDTAALCAFRQFWTVK